ncbi:hypothetical protein [Luteimonas sp. MC1825]|uniref:hypothetical protein n=1 Tax=Luteimonas sp. MC1825 TaxID=2761107 RepID=UPI001613384E|nr:hypothetical protein [Luteimonas sp. MC1825]MBB6599707.1 hypothetical protein [Luteimonas sp. MC1825]QOC87390.1 hypothetical protein IDM46_08910 [Luteimonas sp. MC1825]
MSRVPPRGTPLDHEERELAALLARDRPSAGPSPALDAAILATARKAARDAPGLAPRATRRPRMAWAAGAGLAASLVLAVGVAWQIRPQGDAIEVPDEAPRAAVAREVGTATPPPAPAVENQAAMHDDTAVPSIADPGAASRVEARLPPAPSTASGAAVHVTSAPPGDGMPAMDKPASPAPPAAASPPPPAPVVFDAPEPVTAAAPQRESARQAGAAAADAERRSLAQDAATDAARQRVERTAQQATRPAAAAAAAKAASSPPLRQDDGHAYDQPLDDAPPASADAPEVREAWLARIRELVAEERYAEARASFEEFRRRYPDVDVPRDLRVLLP